MTATQAVAVPGPTRKNPVLRASVLAIVPITVVAVWWIVALVVNTSVITTPPVAFGQMLRFLGSPQYLADLAATAQTVLIAFLLALVLGAVVGFLLGTVPFWMRAVGPILNGMYSIPKVTIFPLFMVFLGLGIVCRTSFAFAHGFFPVAILVMGATLNVRTTEIYLKLAASLNMSRAQLIRVVLLPAVLPAFFTAARLGFGLTFLGAITAEMFASNGGIGYELVRAMETVHVEQIFGQVVLIGIYALIPNALLRWLEVALTTRRGGTVA